MSRGASEHDSPDHGSRPSPGSVGRSSGVGEAVDACATLNGLVHADQSLGQMLTQVAGLAREVIHGAESISITVIEGRKLRSVAFTGGLAVVLDERQYEDGFGPCVDAARTGRVIEIPDTAHDTRYSSFCRLAARQGVQRTLSVGMPTRHRISAGMNIYVSTAPGPFSQETRDMAVSFASYAWIAILNATLYSACREEADQLRAAMVSRAEIEQAKGMIMREHRCTADEAFAMLRHLSGQENRKLSDVARGIVENARGGR